MIAVQPHRLLYVFAFIKFLVLGLLIIPPWSGPDEIGHYSYISDLGKGTFPGFKTSKMDPEARSSAWKNEQDPLNWILAHPPLYHAALAPLSFVLDQANSSVLVKLKWYRSVSALLAVIALMFIFGATRAITGSYSAGVFAISVPTFTPMLATTAGLANHDIAIFSLGAAGTYFFVRALNTTQEKFQLLTLLMFALTSLTKATGVPILVGFTLLFLVVNAFRKSLNFRYAGMVALIWLPVVGWHAYMAIFHDLVLVIYRDQNMISAEKVSFLSFLHNVPVTETVISTFSGFIWVVRDSSVSAVTSFPNGNLLILFMLAIIALLGAAAWSVVASKRWWVSDNAVVSGSLFAGAALCSVAIGIYTATQMPYTAIIIGLVVFLGLVSFASSYRLLIERNASLEFSVVAFAATTCTLILLMHTFYTIYLDRGRAGALHGRYIYMIAPLFLAALINEIEKFPFRKIVYFCVLAGFVLFDSIYWVRFALPIYRSIDNF